MPEIKKETIDGNVVTFYCDEEGVFFAKSPLLDHGVRGKTLQETRTKIRGTLRRLTVKLAIKVHIINVFPPEQRKKHYYSRFRDSIDRTANNVRAVTIAGISQRTHEIMLTFEDTHEKHESSEYGSQGCDSSDIMTRRLRPAEIAQYQKLHAAYFDAYDAFNDYVNAIKIADPKKFIGDQIAERVEMMNAADPIDEPAGDPRVDAPKKARGSRAAKT